MHVTKDIPAIIAEARNRHPAIEMIYSAPLGVHEGLARIALKGSARRQCPSPAG